MNSLFEAYQPGELVQTYRIINTPSDFAKKSLFYVQETGYLKSIKSHLSTRSKLASYLILIVLSGSGTFNVNNRLYSLKPQDCLWINCMDHYTHQSNEKDPWELLWVHFNGKSAGDYYQYFTQSYDNVFHPENPEDYILLIRELIEIHSKKEKYWEILSSKKITDLLTKCMITNNLSHGFGESIISKIDSVRSYLDQNYKEKLLLDQISNSFYISKFHLSREFKKIYGITIIDYLTVKRITCAKELLRFTNQSVEAIALSCGYPDASYFNKVFRKTEAITASEYRKQWRG